MIRDPFSHPLRAVPTGRRDTCTFLLGRATSTSMCSLGRRRPVGSRSQEEGTRIPARHCGSFKFRWLRKQRAEPHQFRRFRSLENQFNNCTIVLLTLWVLTLLLGPGWGRFFLDLTKQGCFGRVYRDVLATCLRKTYPAPGLAPETSFSTEPLSTIRKIYPFIV